MVLLGGPNPPGIRGGLRIGGLAMHEPAVHGLLAREILFRDHVSPEHGN